MTSTTIYVEFKARGDWQAVEEALRAAAKFYGGKMEGAGMYMPSMMRDVTFAFKNNNAIAFKQFVTRRFKLSRLKVEKK